METWMTFVPQEVQDARVWTLEAWNCFGSLDLHVRKDTVRNRYKVHGGMQQVQ